MLRLFHFNFELKAVDDAAKAEANEANEAKADEAVFADEAFDAEADEVDAEADMTNKLDELAVAEGRAKGHVVAKGQAEGYVVACCSQCVVWNRCVQRSLG